MIRAGWNWFGALFGVVVLLGGSILYLTSDSKPAADKQPVAQQQDEEQDPAEPMAEEDHHADADAAEEGSVEVAPAEGSSDKQAGAEHAVIEVGMIDFGYVPETIEISAGTPVILRFTNNGEFKHEVMIGDAHMQEEFAAADDHDEGDDHHSDVMAVTLRPGETADLEVVIDEPGEWFMACHLTGHYEQGQVGTINVTV